MTSTRLPPCDFAASHPGENVHGIGPFHSRRSTVIGRLGMVSSSQPLATAVGIEILNLGGNAADAAIAVGAALNVTEPCSTGIGGDAFCLYWNAKTKTMHGLNGSGRSPAGLNMEMITERGWKTLPLDSALSVTVPGTAAAWVDAHEHFGSKRLSLREVLAPAIRLAREGYPVHELTASSWQRSERLLRENSPNGKEMLLPNGKAPRAGDIMRMPELAKTFESLADNGKRGFYTGRIAQAIIEVVAAKGGVMTLDDLEHHANTGSELCDPIAYEYGATAANGGDGITLHELPPNGQGLVALIALGILDVLQRRGTIGNLLKMPHNSPEYLHALIEALRFAFADAHRYVADPHHGGMDHVEGLLSRAYLDERAQTSFNPQKTTPIEHGTPPATSDTVYLTCTDAQGNACSFIQSNYAGFGTGIIPRGCGFTLANRCATFNLQHGQPNCLGPRKRPYNTIIPAMATRNVNGQRELFMTYGVMGGFMQPQGHVQVLLNILRGYTAQAAIDAPRFCIGAGTPDQGALDSTVWCENGIEEEVVMALCKMGHSAKLASSWQQRMVFGRGQIIMRIDSQTEDANGKSWCWAAGSDPRADGCALAQI